MLVSQARHRAEALRSRAEELREAAVAAARAKPMAGALRGERVAVIAEVKRRSPSKGEINPLISASAQAGAYEAGGAAAISVLTEGEHFGGTVADLDEVVRQASIPVLKKDFHVDPIQLFEAKALGASAALLIVRALAPADLATMIRAADDIGLETLVEIRDEAELERALAVGARLIGINNRDLETLRIDPTTAQRLLPSIPGSIIAIAESGMRTAADVHAAAESGADAVLVGSSVSAAADPTAAVRDLTRVRRVPRRG